MNSSPILQRNQSTRCLLHFTGPMIPSPWCHFIFLFFSFFIFIFFIIAFDVFTAFWREYRYGAHEGTRLLSNKHKQKCSSILISQATVWHEYWHGAYEGTKLLGSPKQRITTKYFFFFDLWGHHIYIKFHIGLHIRVWVPKQYSLKVFTRSILKSWTLTLT